MNKILYTCIVSSMVLLLGCEDIFVKEIELEEFYLLSPGDNIEILTKDLNFWWENVPEAEYYTIQIVSGSFDNINNLVLDSTISSNKFNYTLETGKYEWQVIASNSISYVFSKIHAVTIVDTSVTSNKEFKITLEKPLYKYINQSNISFSWDGPDSIWYRFEIRNNDWNENDISISRIIEEQNLSIELKEGNYFWGVKFKDDASDFVINELNIDLTPPTKAVLKIPEDSAIFVNSIINFEWEHEKDGITEIEVDSIFIADTTSFNSPNGTKYSSITESLTLELLKGTYYWKVISFDKAGNKGGESNIRKFTIEL